jgi:hypothetical protein
MMRRRAVGLIVLLAVFAAGVAAGIEWSKVRGNGVSVNVRMSTRLPSELTALGLSKAQEDSLRTIIIAGQRRTRSVLREIENRLTPVVDSVESEVRSVLTPEQRARFDASHKKRRIDRVEIDTTVRK